MPKNQKKARRSASNKLYFIFLYNFCDILVNKTQDAFDFIFLFYKNFQIKCVIVKMQILILKKCLGKNVECIFFVLNFNIQTKKIFFSICNSCHRIAELLFLQQNLDINYSLGQKLKL